MTQEIDCLACDLKLEIPHSDDCKEFNSKKIIEKNVEEISNDQNTPT